MCEHFICSLFSRIPSYYIDSFLFQILHFSQFQPIQNDFSYDNFNKNLNNNSKNINNNSKNINSNDNNNDHNEYKKIKGNEEEEDQRKNQEKIKKLEKIIYRILLHQQRLFVVNCYYD